MKKAALTETLLILLFINHLFSLNISNYSGYSLVYKILSSVILLLVLYYSQARKTPDRKFIKIKGIKAIGIVSFAAIFISAGTLIYSYNPGFGLHKLVLLLFSQLPSVLIFAFLIVTADLLRVKIFIKISAFFIIIFSAASFIINPFDQSTVYSFQFNRWSHVVSGRVTGFLILSLFLYLIYAKRDMLFYFASLSFLAGFINLFFMTNRTITVTLIFLSGILLIYRFTKLKLYLHPGNNKSFFSSFKESLTDENSAIKSSIFLLVLFIISLSAGYIISKNTGSNRIGNLIELDLKEEDQYQSREFLLKKSIEIIKENPFFGTGLGGFRNYNNDIDLNALKYPHNIFLELLTEFGLIIGGLFSIGLIALLINAFRKNFIIGVIILFALLPALTSKDMTSQMFFLFALLTLSNNLQLNDYD